MKKKLSWYKVKSKIKKLFIIKKNTIATMCSFCWVEKIKKIFLRSFISFHLWVICLAIKLQFIFFFLRICFILFEIMFDPQNSKFNVNLCFKFEKQLTENFLAHFF